MIRKQYKYSGDARKAIEKVAQIVSKVLGSTLGPAGRNYFLDAGITNDGRTIIEHLRFADECEDAVSVAFHEIARQQDKDAGDGTTTAMVFGAELTLDMLPKIGDLDVPVFGQKSSMEFARELEVEKDKAIAILKELSKPIENLEQLEQVAMTAMEDKEAAKIVAKALWEGGKDTYPVMKDGFNGKVEQSRIDGVEYPLSIATTSMFNQAGYAEHKNALVIVVNHAFEQYQEITPFMASLMQDKPKLGSLVIVGKQFSVPFVNAISEVRKRANLPIVLVSSPKLHNDTFADIAAYVDANMIDTHPKTGRKITELCAKDAGFVETVVARENTIQFIGGRGKEAVIPLPDNRMMTRVEHRVEEIRKAAEQESDPAERMHIEKRIAALLGGITTIFVDAKTAAEKYYLKLKVEDAMNSCRAALNGGMVTGGGKSYLEVAAGLGKDSLLYNALLSCGKRITDNNMGQELNLEGVHDAYLVAKGAIENAVSVVKTLITIEGIMVDKDKDLVDDLAQRLTGNE